MSSHSVQFVQEHPEKDHLREKRLRVVFSCDSCRMRKVRCVQRPGVQNGPCETCVEARIKCRYEDKDRYDQIRKGTSAGSLRPRSSTSSSSGQSTKQRTGSPFYYEGSTGGGSPDHSPSSGGTSSLYGAGQTIPTGMATGSLSEEYRSSYDSGPVAQSGHPHATYLQRGTTYHTTPSHQQHAQMTIAYPQNTPASVGSSSGAQAAPQAAYTPLFEGHYPHSALMPTLLHAFFSYRGSMHAFLVYEDVWKRFQKGNLDPSLANAIAALAAAYVPEISRVTGMEVSAITAAYLQNAQNIVYKKVSASPTLSILYATILIATAQASGNTLVNGFKYNAEHALTMAKELQLNSEATIYSLAGGDLSQMTRLRAAWESITQLFPANRSS